MKLHANIMAHADVPIDFEVSNMAVVIMDTDKLSTVLNVSNAMKLCNNANTLLLAITNLGLFFSCICH